MSGWIAAIAIQFLLIQSLLGAVLSGAMAAPAAPDTAGIVLCVAHPVSAVPDSRHGSSGDVHLPDCCLSGCLLFAAALLPAPQAESRPMRAHCLCRRRCTARRQNPCRRPRQPGAPGDPRAPPGGLPESAV